MRSGSAIASMLRPIRTRRGHWRTCTTGSPSTNTRWIRRWGNCRWRAAGCRSRWRSRCRAWGCARCGRCSRCRAMRWRVGFPRMYWRTWTRCAARWRRRCRVIGRRNISRAASSSTARWNRARRCCSRCAGLRRTWRRSSPDGMAACSASRWCWNTNVARTAKYRWDCWRRSAMRRCCSNWGAGGWNRRACPRRCAGSGSLHASCRRSCPRRRTFSKRARSREMSRCEPDRAALRASLRPRRTRRRPGAPPRSLPSP